MARIHDLDEMDKQLLNLLQRPGIPLLHRPYAHLADLLHIAEAEVIQRVQVAKQARVIRQMSAIFDSRALGYKGSLIAGRYHPDRLDDAALVVNRHPGVSHNYKREHRYNMWYTLTVPPFVDIEAEIQRIHNESGALDTLFLPTMKLFKIGVNFDMTGKENMAATSEEEPAEVYVSPRRHLTERQIAAVRALQRDLPVVEEPFRALAATENLAVEELLEMAVDFQLRGEMRRFAAVLHHHTAGFRANGMGVWVCPEEQLSNLGPVMASFRGVSHCYQRPAYPERDWPYTLFTMVHGKSQEEVEGVLDAISQKTHLTEREVLYSVREYKKIRVAYYMHDDFYRNRLPLNA